MFVINAMSGTSLEKTFVRFRKTEMGKKILSENRNLLTTLLDRESLRTHDVGTLGQAYLGFVEREQDQRGRSGGREPIERRNRGTKIQVVR